MLNNEVLYELMKEKEIKNIRQLSLQTGVNYTTLSYMLSGHDMHVSSLVELSRFFNVPMDYLINKSFGIVTYREDGSTFFKTSSLIEATILSK